MITPNTVLSEARRSLSSPRRPGQCMSRAELADAVNAALSQLYPGRDLAAHYVDSRWIGKLERGEHRWPSEERRTALRHVLGIPTDTRLGLYSPRRTDSARTGNNHGHAPSPDWLNGLLPAAELSPLVTAAAGVRGTQNSISGPRASDTVHLLMPALRRTLDRHDLPPDGPIGSLPELRRRVENVVRRRLQSHYRLLAHDLLRLLPELQRAVQEWSGHRQAAAAGLLTQAYRGADAVADKFGYYDLSARIIGLMAESARQSGDELAVAAARYVRAETFFANGQFDVGRSLLESAADQLTPEGGTSAAAAYGALHMRAAVLGARGGQLGSARAHLEEARVWAHCVPEGVYYGTMFGPTSVHIHHVALGIDGNDPDAAIKVAAQWRPSTDIPGERRSHFYIEMARAHAMVGLASTAFEALLEARSAAPEHVHCHPQVHDLLGQLSQTTLANNGRLQDFRDWLEGKSEIKERSGEAGPATPLAT
ncbi:hypothetical protein [Plantactinospora sp. CA-290183]|uniref:hypothetical protein n=1 Tax=Plantactinospora sp. CA-290183 TaxID=3240006 RepID=UPI003D9109BA